MSSSEIKSRIDQLRSKLSELKLVGLTGSTTQVTEAPLILLEGLEDEVREEDIVVIVNRNRDFIFAVCRRGTGINENLKVGGYSPGIAYVRSKGQPPSRAKESYHFTLSFIGVLTDDGLRANDVIVAPGSPVYLFMRENGNLNPLEFIKPKDWVSGGFLANSNGSWEIPFNKKFISYHIGVFGATGSGKSRLARHLLIPLLIKAGYRVLVFDWEGVDYSPYFREVVSAHDFKMDAFTVADLIVREADYFGYSSEEGVVPSVLINVVTRRIDGETWWDRISNTLQGGQELPNLIEREVLNVLRQRSRWRDNEAVWKFRLKFGLNKISIEDWELIYKFSKGILIEDFQFPRPGELKVIDLSEIGDELKLSFLSK